MSSLENYTFDELQLEQSASYSKTLTEKELVLFAATSGDLNPVHLDADYAATTSYQQRIAHGAWTSSLISAAIAMTLPGPGSIYISQDISFRLPVTLGDTVTVNLTVTEKKTRRNMVTINTTAVNQHGKTIAKGSAVVIAPTEKVILKTPTLPDISIK
jgi:acyl dehydratase